MKDDFKMCMHNTCTSFNKLVTNFKYTFEIPFNLTDGTGTISRVRASSKCIEKLLEVKRPLIKNINDPKIHKNLIVFKVHHTEQFPFKETLLPISKRKVMNYMIQSKLIKNKNLTKID